MTKLIHLFRRFVAWFSALNQREKLLVGASGVFAVVFLLQQAFGAIEDHLESTNQLVVARRTQLEEAAKILRRYSTLRQRREALQTTYAESQLTFEEVTNDLDRVVKDAIGSDNYELKKPHAPTPFGFNYEKQEFTLIVKSLTLPQLVKLLYQIEQGARPIFLSKVDMTKALNGTDFSAVLEIYSISKSSSQAPAGSAES
ncbi:MAG: hypothetical protein U0136_04700 [Bdellovibrionota bacterium]